ncbi:MAG: Tetracycline resistance protein, class C [Chlamydiales bacterium]|nr:Tetracycline resistance protein, class C [Chlamydiales bacterium]MCH9620189.1 Tetracycline resistance protein, class C [Chlamydiales bacterium]MCH9623096.1 Tetracycline resistance protein, class C [Chlamydiales bacterium]
MPTNRSRSTLFTLFFSGFIDYAGIAIVYPVFAYLLFDPSFDFFSPGATDATKGLWLGILIALHPLMQFFSAPFMGALSDVRGRRKVILGTLFIALSGYVFAILGVTFHSLVFLAIYRALVGIAAGNGSVLGAAIADVSDQENKARNFGLLSMSFGAGFTLAPFVGGVLAQKMGFSSVFWVSLILVSINILLVFWKLQESHYPQVHKNKRVALFESFSLIKDAVKLKALHSLFIGLLIFTLGWAFFTEFIALFLSSRFAFRPEQTGLYYGYGAIFYALFAGFVVSPIANRVGPRKALFFAQLFSGIALLMLVFIYSPKTLWVYTPVVQFFMAFIYPTTATIISNTVSVDIQGRTMGIYQAINAIGVALSPFVCGTLVGVFPWIAVVAGGTLMILGALAFRFFQRPQEEGAPSSLLADKL